MAFDNLTDSQVREIAGSVNTFFDVNQVKALLEVADAIAGGAGTVSWADIPDKPATFAPTIGTTATTAKAGNYTPPNATTSVRGVVLQGVAVANAAAAPTQAEYNALLASLRTAGVIAP